MTYLTDDILKGTALKAGVTQWEAQLDRASKRGLKAGSATLMAFSLAACDFGGSGGGGSDPDPITGDAILTVDTDDVNSGVDSDTITAPLVTNNNVPNQMTLTSGDDIDGEAGTDTLIITYNSSVSGFSVQNVETIILTNTSVGSPTLNFAGVDLSGVTEIRLTDNAGNAFISDLAGVAPVTIANNNARDVELTYNATSVVGTTTQVISLQDATNDWDLIIGAGVEILSLSSDGTSANDIDDLVTTDVTTLVLTGDEDLTIDDIDSAVLLQVNGSTADGDLTITHNETGITTDMDGGDGDDTFFLGVGYDLADQINGGAGSDVLSVEQGNITAIVSSTASTVVNVEKIQVTGPLSSNGTINFQHFSATELELMNGTVGAANLVLKTEDVVQINGNVGAAAATTDDLTLSMGSNGTSDEATLILAGTTINGDLIADDLEELEIQTTSGPVIIEGTTTLGASVTAGTETLTITGNQNIDFLTGADINADIIDASALTGELDIQSGSSSSLANSIVIGGTNNDYLGFGDNVVNTVTGGAGNDKIVFDINVSDTITGGSGNDIFTMDTDTVYTANLAGSVITDFDVVNDTLELSLTTLNEWVEEGTNGTVVSDWDGVDVVTGNAVVEQINGGTGTLTQGDIIALSGTFTAATAFTSLSDNGPAGNDFSLNNNMDDNDGMIIAYSTGTDIEIALVRMGNGPSSDSDDFDDIDVVLTLSGMTMADFLAADIDFIA